MSFTYDVEAELWAVDGPGGWHFVTLPQDLTAPLKTIRGQAPAFGSMRVEAQVGRTRWQTSLFPDGKRGAFLLPVKADVRRREKIAAGDTVKVRIEIAL